MLSSGSVENGKKQNARKGILDKPVPKLPNISRKYQKSTKLSSGFFFCAISKNQYNDTICKNSLLCKNVYVIQSRQSEILLHTYVTYLLCELQADLRLFRQVLSF